MTEVASRFSDDKLSSAYAQYRPVYSDHVREIIISYMKSEQCSGFDVALDVACGSGQSTFLLTESFKKVIGLDISPTQIDQAKLTMAKSLANNVEFMVGDAHSISVESSSVDLLTCAMGWHWLDSELFYSEAKRVLKPRGCLAIYGHGVTVQDNDRVNNLFESFRGEARKSGCIAEQNSHVVNNYEAVKLPFSQSQRFEFSLSQESTIDQLLGFFSSISYYSEYCKQYPNNTLLKRLRESYEAESEKCQVEKFTLAGFAILGVKE